MSKRKGNRKVSSRKSRKSNLLEGIKHRNKYFMFNLTLKTLKTLKLLKFLCPSNKKLCIIRNIWILSKLVYNFNKIIN